MLRDNEKAALLLLMAEAFTWIRHLNDGALRDGLWPGKGFQFPYGSPMKDLHTPEEVFIYVGRLGYAFHNVPRLIAETNSHPRDIYWVIAELDYIDGTPTAYGVWANALAKHCAIELPDRAQFIAERPAQYGYRWTTELIEEVRSRHAGFIVIRRDEYDYLQSASLPQPSMIRRLFSRLIDAVHPN